MSVSELWMQTANGRKFYLTQPTADQVYADDILAQLPLIPCFTGAQKDGKHEFPYSVAQHCLLVSRLVAPELALDGLLHDAWKIYVSDLTRPLNQLLNWISCNQWGTVRGRIQQAVAERFSLTYPLPDAVEDGDRLARATELRDIMADVPEAWSLKLPEPVAEVIVPLHPCKVRKLFRARWQELQPRVFLPSQPYATKYRATLTERGLCYRCPAKNRKQVVPGGRLCEDCRTAEMVRVRNYRNSAAARG